MRSRKVTKSEVRRVLPGEVKLGEDETGKVNLVKIMEICFFFFFLRQLSVRIK